MIGWRDALRIAVQLPFALAASLVRAVRDRLP